MTLTSEQKISFASRLHEAARSGTQVPMLTSEASFQLEEAYDVQETLIQKRISEGHPLVGMKMGLTSLAKMEQMGVDSPIYGHLTSDMLLDDGGNLDLSPYGHPRVEPEVAFIMAHDPPRRHRLVMRFAGFVRLWKLSIPVTKTLNLRSRTS